MLAQNGMGNCYYCGKGMAQDCAEAVKWYRKAAEQGNARAQYNLGASYSNGKGVSKDLSEAKKWYEKAAGQGNEKARQGLKGPGRSTGSGDSARRRSGTWKTAAQWHEEAGKRLMQLEEV